MSAAPVLMLVDDSGDDLALALRALRRLARPVDVRTARDGREALAALHVRGPSGSSHLVKPADGLDGGAVIADAARYWIELNLPPTAG